MNEKFPAQGYKDNVLLDCFADAKRYFLDHYLAVDRAHAVMLAEQGIITADEQRDILRAIEGLDLDNIRRAEYDGSVEDLFCYLQREITAGCDDSEAAGKLHTTRSRNDIDVTIYRLFLREQTLDLIDACTELHRVLINLARQHHESLMPAYTHTQPAQPTTIAHYLLAMAENTSRDIRRLQRAYANMNLCPLGACAITTSGFPISRERVAALLGFDGPTGNSYASIASVDYFIELLGAGAALIINIGKFSQEFLLMAMMEFGVIRLPDGYVQSSSIMPQKRNPVAVEHVRAIASKSLGQMLGVMTAVHNTPFGDINDVEDDLQPLIYSAVRDGIRAVSLLANTLSAAEFNIELLAKRAEDNFITVTELADTLVRTDCLSFSAAHAIVADCVAAATEAEDVISHDMLQAAAKSRIGRGLKMTNEELAVSLSAENFVRVRDIIGGPAPATTRAALKDQLSHDEVDRKWAESARSRLQAGQQMQNDAIATAID